MTSKGGAANPTPKNAGATLAPCMWLSTARQAQARQLKEPSQAAPRLTQFITPSSTMWEKDFFISNTVAGTYLAKSSRRWRSGCSGSPHLALTAYALQDAGRRRQHVALGSQQRKSCRALRAHKDKGRGRGPTPLHACTQVQHSLRHTPEPRLKHVDVLVALADVEDARARGCNGKSGMAWISPRPSMFQRLTMAGPESENLMLVLPAYPSHPPLNTLPPVLTRGGGGVLEVPDLKDEFHVGQQADALIGGQRQQPIVVHHAVHACGPE